MFVNGCLQFAGRAKGNDTKRYTVTAQRVALWWTYKRRERHRVRIYRSPEIYSIYKGRARVG